MRNLKILLLVIISATSLYSFAGGSDTQAINAALKSGNSTALAKYLNTNVEIVILDNEDVYSRTQAQIILKDFFAKNKPSNFTILHQGGKEGANYIIGNLTTSTKTYRVYYLLKKSGNKSYIQQLRIEDE